MRCKRMLSTLVSLLLLILPLTSVCAETAGYQTPDVPADAEIRASFGAWVQQTLVPYLNKDRQEKWSAKRCREIADMVEATGFPIAEKWKDKLYRTKREHRLYDSEAFAYIVCSQYGEYWEWTAEDKSWADDMRVAAGMQSGKRFFVPSPTEGTTSQVIEAAREAICSRYGVTDEQWRAYHVNADFMAGGTDDGGTARFWALSVMQKWGEGYDFAYYYTPSTGDVEVVDMRK